MAVDLVAPMNRLIAVLLAAPVSLQTAVLGVPNSLSTRTAAYVTLDAWETNESAPPGVSRGRVTYQVMFGRRVSTDEPAAETELAQKIPAFHTAMLAERRTQLNGTVTALEQPDYSRARDPQYLPLAGQEFRLYPVLIHATVQETY